MQIEYHGKPAYTMAVCYLDFQESLRVEATGMAAMSDSIAVSADAGPGGVVSGLLRKTLGGESFFMGRYTATVQDAWVAVSPARPGDITDIVLQPGRPGIVAESGSLLAMSEGVDVDVKWAGLRNVVMREGATMLHAEGDGHLLLCSFGGIVEHQVAAGQSIIVDTGHLVAYTDTCTTRIGPLGGLAVSAFSGEGLVAKISGPGSVYVQTRSEIEHRNWILPERSQNA